MDVAGALQARPGALARGGSEMKATPGVAEAASAMGAPNFFAEAAEAIGNPALSKMLRAAPPAMAAPVGGNRSEPMRYDAFSEDALMSMASTPAFAVPAAPGGVTTSARIPIGPNYYAQVIPRWREFQHWVRQEDWKQEGFLVQAVHEATVLDAMLAEHGPDYVHKLPFELVATRLSQLVDERLHDAEVRSEQHQWA